MGTIWLNRTGRPIVGGLAAFAVLVAVCGTVAAAAHDPAKVIDGFEKACQENKNLSGEQRQKVLKIVADGRANADLRQTVITDALREMYPDFRAAQLALVDEDTEKAVAAFKKLSESDDPYLATESSYFRAWALMMDERFEDALPLLNELNGDAAAGTLLYKSDAMYMQGIAAAGVLDRDKAIKTLKRFAIEYPDAPERMRVAAAARVADLEGIKKGSIIDVEDRMEFSRRKLSLEDSGDPTQKEQKTIVAMLDKLIKEAEKKESGS